MDVFASVEQLLGRYGYWVLLFGLPLDAIASPVPPGNTTLTFAGYLAYKHVLDVWAALLFAYVGALIGITATYWIGRKAGRPLLARYGKWLWLKPGAVARMERVYGRHGHQALLFSFFIPGIRQFAGYFAGMLQVPFRSFALYAYIGAFLWVTLFVGLGYVFGEQWQAVFALAGRHIWWMAIAIVALIGLTVYARRRRMRT